MRLVTNRAMRLMWRAHVQLACVCVSLCLPRFIYFCRWNRRCQARHRGFWWGAVPLRIKAAAGDQLEAMRCGRVAVEDGRS